MDGNHYHRCNGHRQGRLKERPCRGYGATQPRRTRRVTEGERSLLNRWRPISRLF